jgi:hypothetical protein
MLYDLVSVNIRVIFDTAKFILLKISIVLVTSHLFYLLIMRVPSSTDCVPFFIYKPLAV